MGIFIFIALCSMLPLIISVYMDDSLQAKHKGLLPFNWGYFNCWMGMFSPFFILANQENNDLMVFFFPSVILAILSLIALKRNRWVWLFMIILQLNPILWIINGIYLKNRWSEMNKKPHIDLDEPSRVSTDSFSEISPLMNKSHSNNKKKFIIGSAFWAFIVLSFIFMLEPFGDRLSDREWWRVIKVIFVPPIIFIVGSALYKKYMFGYFSIAPMINALKKVQIPAKRIDSKLDIESALTDTEIKSIAHFNLFQDIANNYRNMGLSEWGGLALFCSECISKAINKKRMGSPFDSETYEIYDKLVFTSMNLAGLSNKLRLYPADIGAIELSAELAEQWISMNPNIKEFRMLFKDFEKAEVI